MKQHDVIQTIRNHRHELVHRYGVHSLALFGSVARDAATDVSDIDMLVEFGQPTGYFGLVALQEFLTQILHRPVDLGTLRSLKPRVRASVEREMRSVL
ncbi:MAG: nucleotidyltransferase family protein [Caldilineaceae bacterium]|nr:nucleotidyltransferase family protein [Caldilineaceae bacterium]